MSEIKIIGKGEKYAHASVGMMETINSKLFLKEQIDATSCEISFGSLPSGAAVPFFHSHSHNEEIYIILSGHGRFQVDNEVFRHSRRLGNPCRHQLRPQSEMHVIPLPYDLYLHTGQGKQPERIHSDRCTDHRTKQLALNIIIRLSWAH